MEWEVERVLLAGREAVLVVFGTSVARFFGVEAVLRVEVLKVFVGVVLGVEGFGVVDIFGTLDAFGVVERLCFGDVILIGVEVLGEVRLGDS